MIKGDACVAPTSRMTVRRPRTPSDPVPKLQRQHDIGTAAVAPNQALILYKCLFGYALVGWAFARRAVMIIEGSSVNAQRAIASPDGAASRAVLSV